MNTWQVLGQLQSMLRARSWGDLGGDPVFHSESVIVTAAIGSDQYVRYSSPLVLLSVGAGQSDEEEPTLLQTTITARIVVVSASDARGEGALMGAHAKTADDSGGRGLLEVETEVMDTIALANGLEGIEIEFRATGQLLAELVDDRYIVARDYQHSLFCSSKLSVPSSGDFNGSLDSPGVVSLSWVPPWNRYDFGGIIVRRRANTNPVSPVDGDSVTVTPGVNDTLDSVPASGVRYHYGLWPWFDPHDKGAPWFYGAPRFVSVQT